ncbi:ribosomal protein L5 [Tanacetum coccineum]
MFLVDAGLATARMSMQDEPKGVPINRATGFENKDPLLKPNYANVMEVPGSCKIRVVPKAAPSDFIIKNGKLAMEIPCGFLVEIREKYIQFLMEMEFCEFSIELEDHFEIFKHIRGFNVTIVTLANTQDEILPPWSGFFQKDEGESHWSTSKVSRSMRPDSDVPFSREENRVNKVAIRMNGSSLDLSFAPRGAGLNPVCDNHKAFDHRISRDPRCGLKQQVEMKNLIIRDPSPNSDLLSWQLPPRSSIKLLLMASIEKSMGR